MPTVRTNDIETYYERRGDGPPVVFIHGMIMTATMWESQLGALDDAFTTIAYDVRGHGRTGGADRNPYSIDLFASDLAVLLDELDIDRTVVCGLSMGGAIAQAFAAAHPERVAGLVLADTFPPGPLPLTGRLALANIRFLARLDRLINYKTLNRWQLRVGNLLLPGVSGDEVTIQRIVDESPTIPHAEFVKIADATARFPKDSIDLSRVTAPTLILHGEHLPMANEEITGQLVRQLTSTDPTVHVVPGSGHASNLDNPEFFTARLQEFLTGCVYSARPEDNDDPSDAGESP
ncbi:alpha/beta fold hydrolase [Haladaptatus sp. CMAA 1911]|uniref:alpha/beta fold hydrolase n=1 Tax=unclassified Haladaptatus TaxID=2622732 RepID=UPI003754AC47